MLRYKFNVFFSKYGYIIAYFLSCILAFLNLYVSNYLSYIYLFVILLSSLFLDVNKITVLCLLSVFGLQALHVFGLMQFAIGYTVICIKKIVINKQKLDKTFILPIIVLISMTMLFFCVNFDLKNIKTIAQVILPIFLLIEVYFLREDFKIDKIIKQSTYSLIFMCFISLLMLLVRTNKVEVIYHDAVGTSRFKGLTGHENGLAAFSIMLMTFNLLLYFKEKISATKFYFLEGVLFIIGFATKSKMFLILLILLLFCFFIKEFDLDSDRAKRKLAGFIVLAGIFCLLFHNKIIEIFNRFTDYFRDGSFLDMITTGRIGIWKYYIGLWLATPLTILFGIGGSYQDPYINYSHNQYIEILCKYGIVGLILVVSLIIYFILLTKKYFVYHFENYIAIVFIALICTMGLLDSSIAGIVFLLLSCFCITYVGNPSKLQSKNKIPKIIHYVWFGNKKIPAKSKEFINKWREKLPDYELVLWNENNFPLDSAPEYVKQAYKNKKYAFVSDYVRLYALFQQGGIYLDTDVEIIKSFDSLLNNDFFIGRENAVYLSTSVIGAVKNNKIVKEILDSYQEFQFFNEEGHVNYKTNVEVISEYLKNVYDYDFVNSEQCFEGCTIYKMETFSPKNYLTNKIAISNNTYSIHHFDATWKESKGNHFKEKLVAALAKLPVSYSNALFDVYKELRYYYKKIRG